MVISPPYFWVDVVEIILSIIVVACLVYWAFKSGSLYGAKKAFSEITQSIGHHCDTVEGEVYEELGKALDATKGMKSHKALIEKLWRVGDEMGKACYLNGFEEERRMNRPDDGELRLDLTEQEVRDLHWIAHIGFRYVMAPSTEYPYALETQEEAERITKTIEQLNRRLPIAHDGLEPHEQSFDRQTMIWDKWPSKPDEGV